MNIKKVLSLVGVTFAVFLLVGTIAFFSQSASESNLFKKSHEFRTVNKINQYPKGHECVKKCTAAGGFNCGMLSLGCCESEALCVRKWGIKKCQKYKQFDCELV